MGKSKLLLRSGILSGHSISRSAPISCFYRSGPNEKDSWITSIIVYLSSSREVYNTGLCVCRVDNPRPRDILLSLAEFRRSEIGFSGCREWRMCSNSENLKILIKLLWTPS